MILAALAADAAPGKTFRHFRKLDLNPELDVLQLWDSQDNSYQLLSPRTTAGIVELSQLVAGLKTISYAEDLPFETNEIIGQSRAADGGAVVVLSDIVGEAPELSRFAAGPFSQSIGEALAAIHKINPDLIRDAGLPEYDAQGILHKKVAEVDRVAATGKIPAGLLARWEEALEDVGLFRFHPTVTHAQINQDSLLVSGGKLVGITNWSQLSISDPAEDLKYLAGGALGSTFEDAILHYRAARENADENIVQRAILYSELELASWLAHCIQVGDEAMIADAQSMLTDLDQQLKAQTLRSLRAAGFIGLGSAGLAGATAQLNQLPVTQQAEEEVSAEESTEAPAEAASDSQLSEPNPDELF